VDLRLLHGALGPPGRGPLSGAALLGLILATEASAWHGRVALEGHGALLNSGARGPLANVNFGYGLRGGLEQERWGLFAHVEQSAWLGTELGGGVVPGVLNIGVGVEHRFAGGLIRSSVTVGPSVLLFATALDPAGSVGVFIDLRPLGLRWALDSRLTLGFDPLNVALLAPVLTGFPLLRTQFRSAVVIEVSL
jgi:hypothetical protein